MSKRFNQFQDRAGRNKGRDKNLLIEKKGNYFIAKSENLCKFAVQYSFGVLRPYILAQSQSESPPRHMNELK